MTEISKSRSAEIYDRLQDTDGVTAALKRAAREAVRDHGRSGVKIVVWRDNQIVWEDSDSGASASAEPIE